MRTGHILPMCCFVKTSSHCIFILQPTLPAPSYPTTLHKVLRHCGHLYRFWEQKADRSVPHCYWQHEEPRLKGLHTILIGRIIQHRASPRVNAPCLHLCRIWPHENAKIKDCKWHQMNEAASVTKFLTKDSHNYNYTDNYEYLGK